MNQPDIELPSNRKFGLFFTTVFGLVAAHFWYTGLTAVGFLLCALAVILLVVTHLRADALAPLNRLWMKFGLLLGRIVSPIVLGVLFFGLFTPISLLMKAIGRDELRLKVANRTSHWKERDVEESRTDPFKYQF